MFSFLTNAVDVCSQILKMSLKAREVSSFFRFAMDQFLVRLSRIIPMASMGTERIIRLRGNINVCYRLNLGDIQSIREVWLDEAYRLPFPSKPGVLVDLGANIGMTSCWLAKRYGFSTIIAVEPSSTNARLARLNFQLNGLKASVIEAAAGPSDGVVLFEENTSSNAGHVADRGQPVQMLSMQSILRDLSDDVSVNLVKLDIEGGEEPLLSGNLAWLDRVDGIIAEFHPSMIDYPRMVKILQAAGFTYIPAGSAHPGSMDSFVRSP